MSLYVLVHVSKCILMHEGALIHQTLQHGFIIICVYACLPSVFMLFGMQSPILKTPSCESA